MFYSQFILAKKGPLGTIWIAAHLERKLRKNQVADTDIGVSVDSILFPDVPIALRLSSHLLLGVVRIYSRKVNYLFDDCSEALLKIKQAFRSAAVDLPPEESTAPYHSITLPETFDLDDFELPDSDIFQGNYVDHHVSTREQITLQDNMEGVVYSTSQFGLDERFGDGDTSGLDFEEELLLDKVAASAHAGVLMDLDNDPQASGKPMTPLNHDDDHEEQNSPMLAPASVNETGHPTYDSEFVEYAHAPCTPGLMEEPNLSNVQEASAFDDHLEIEEQTLMESGTIENLEKDYKKLEIHHGDRNAEGESLLNEMDPATVRCMPAEENGYVSSAKEMEQLNLQGDSPSAAATMDHISSDIADSVKDKSLVSEFSDRINTASDVANRGEDLQNGVISKNEHDGHSSDPVLDGVDSRGVKLDEAETSASIPHEASSLHESCGNVEKPYPLSDAVAVNIECPPELECENPETEAFLVPKDSTVSTAMHILQRCNSLVNEPGMLKSGGNSSVDPQSSSKESEIFASEASLRDEPPHASTEVPVEGGHTIDVTNPVLEENQDLRPDSNEKLADYNKVNDQSGNVIARDSRSETSDSSELPAPEKLLSVPETVADLPNNNLLVESTPDNAVSVGEGIDGSTVNTVSGKKRSFTESTLTMQSVNSVESFGMTRSRTGEIPDDDDLLSSILVGRRSSVLKLKPTPVPRPQITSVKRPRSVARSTASKRKVLMDDTMVLHGDTIRQQLTSTEDIRRIRKKAPCTRTEIWTIQKQFLEEEIFLEALFTGSSKELLSLHSQTFDLSEIRVCQDEKATTSETAYDLDFSAGLNVAKETGREVSAEDVLLGNAAQGQPVEVPLRTETQQVGEHLLSSEHCDIQVQIKDNSDFPKPISSEHEFFEERAEMEIDGQSIAVADALHPADIVGVEPSSSCDFALGNTLHTSASSEVPPASLGATDASLPFYADDSGALPDHKLNMQSGYEVENVEVSEKTDGEHHVVLAEPKDGDKFLLEETEGTDSSANRSADPSITISPLDTGGCNNQVVLTFDHAVEEIGKSGLGVVNGDQVLASNPDLDANNYEPTSTGIFYEEFNVDSSNPMEINADLKSAISNEGEYPGWQEFDPQVDAKIVAGDHAATEDHRGLDALDYTVDGHDTGFLNVDDDEVDEEDNEYMPSTEETGILDNSGWSSRTRAVAKYLQTLFDKEAENGKKVLPMDNLLFGKTRKEASRMFFEALVLKTKDYIHVEQGNPFDNINIKPRIKLQKSDF